MPKGTLLVYPEYDAVYILFRDSKDTYITYSYYKKFTKQYGDPHLLTSVEFKKLRDSR